MKVRLAIAALFLAALGIALWQFGVFSPSPTPTGGPSEGPIAKPPPEVGFPLGPREPTGEPEPVYPSFAAPVKALMLGQRVRSFPAWVAQIFDISGLVRYRSWYAEPPPEGFPTHSAGLSELTAPPTAADLDEAQVLIVSALDPGRVAPEFWTHVADRLRADSLGLLLFPDWENGQKMAEIAALKPYLPVAKAGRVAAIEPGGPVAGIYVEARPLKLVEAEAEHPAARIVAFKGWNVRWWETLGRGGAKAPWSTKFLSPVETLADGARVLVRLDAGSDSPPALVAAPHDVRVLWAGGFFDLDDHDDGAYRNARAGLAFRALLHNWIAWLASAKP